jgi:MauM/NapG family ferredoxin protein
MKKHVHMELGRFTVQGVSLAAFLLLLSSLSYPLGPEGPLLQWLSRTDPWLVLSRLRWQGNLPGWAWLPLVTILVTVLGGRIFCGWICPFGALLAFTDKLSRTVLGGLSDLRVRMLHTLHPLRYYWLLFLAVIFLLGSNWVFFLTPFALFSHEVVRVLQGLIPWALIAVIAGTILFSRIWCSVLCPTGVLLSLTSRIRLFGYRVTGECVHCGKCVKECPVGAATEDSGAVKEWCLACGTCQNVCPVDALSWQQRSSIGAGRGRETVPAADHTAPVHDRPSRRRFFKVAFTVAIAAALWKKVVWAADKVLRPPGALPEDEFNAVCNRCGRCIQVCPNRALWPMDISDGVANFETPRLVPRKGRCDLCLACQDVCPTRAITHMPAEQIRIGRAHITKSRCLAWNEQKLCFLCGEQCPFQAIEGDEKHRPTVLTDKCVGCGACENGCPVEGEAAIRVFPR